MDDLKLEIDQKLDAAIEEKLEEHKQVFKLDTLINQKLKDMEAKMETEKEMNRKGRSACGWVNIQLHACASSEPFYNKLVSDAMNEKLDAEIVHTFKFETIQKDSVVGGDVPDKGDLRPQMLKISNDKIGAWAYLGGKLPDDAT